MKSVKEWMEVIPPDIEIPTLNITGMYLICASYINKLSEVDEFRNFVVHKHYFRNR